MEHPLAARPEWMPSSVERRQHREWIGGRILTLLSHYWRDDDPVELTAAIGKDWADVLEGFPKEAIEAACLRFMRTGKRKPVPGEIYQLAAEAMPRPQIVRQAPPPEPARPPRVTAEQAEAIMKQAGFRPRKFGGSDDEV